MAGVLVLSSLGVFLRRLLNRRKQRAEQSIDETMIKCVPISPSRYKNIGFDRRVALWATRGAIKNWRTAVTILHCRGPYSADIGLFIRSQLTNSRIIYDVRGLAWAEQAYGQYNWPWDEKPPAQLYQEFVRDGERMKAADHVICVSNAMADYVKRHYGLTRGEVHSAVERDYHQTVGAGPADTGEIAQELQLTDKFVLAYSGSIYPRQRFHQGMLLAKALLDRMPSAFLLILTPQATRAQEVVREVEIPLERTRIDTMSHPEVKATLPVADIGLITTGLFEEAHLSNVVCCPIKFAEYLAAGVPVVLAERIGDYSEVARQHDLGVVLGADESLEHAAARAVSSFTHHDRLLWGRRCYEFASRHLSSDVRVRTLRHLYTHLGISMAGTADICL